MSTARNGAPCRVWFPWQHLLGKVGEVLDDLGDEGERAGGLVIRVLLHQVEEAGGHDGRAQEAQEQRGTDQALTDVLLAPVQALLLPGCKHLLQLTREHAEKQKKTKKKKKGNKIALATRCKKLNC